MSILVFGLTGGLASGKSTVLDVFRAEIYFFTRIPAQVYASDVASVVAMAFGLSFLATLYPAWRAARLDPVEALRYE